MKNAIRKITVYETGDGVHHTSELMAEHHLQCRTIYDLIRLGLELSGFDGANDHHAAHVVNVLCNKGNRDEVRKLMDLVEKMEGFFDEDDSQTSGD